jgi:hypothetical protein
MGLEVAHTQYGGCTHHVKKSQGTSTKLRRSVPSNWTTKTGLRAVVMGNVVVVWPEVKLWRGAKSIWSSCRWRIEAGHVCASTK